MHQRRPSRRQLPYRCQRQKPKRVVAVRGVDAIEARTEAVREISGDAEVVVRVVVERSTQSPHRHVHRESNQPSATTTPAVTKPTFNDHKPQRLRSTASNGIAEVASGRAVSRTEVGSVRVIHFGRAHNSGPEYRNDPLRTQGIPKEKAALAVGRTPPPVTAPAIHLLVLLKHDRGVGPDRAVRHGATLQRRSTGSADAAAISSMRPACRALTTQRSPRPPIGSVHL